MGTAQDIESVEAEIGVLLDQLDSAADAVESAVAQVLPAAWDQVIRDVITSYPDDARRADLASIKRDLAELQASASQVAAREIRQVRSHRDADRGTYRASSFATRGALGRAASADLGRALGMVAPLCFRIVEDPRRAGERFGASMFSEAEDGVPVFVGTSDYVGPGGAVFASFSEYSRLRSKLEDRTYSLRELRQQLSEETAIDLWDQA